MEIIDLLNYAKRNGASDLHLTPDFYPCLRVNGEITPMNQNPKLSGEDIKSLIYSILTDSQRASYEKDFELDFAIQFGEDMRFRVNAFVVNNGPAAVFRTIPTEVFSLDQLNCPSIFRNLCDLHKGLVLVTGPTGSGKSTTLAAIINEINLKYKKHILTVEDPIEFVHNPKQSIINQREIHSNTKSFATALKSALREDPDVILVGEMRDLETISLALTAAETGHLVFGTLHTTSAPKTIDRIIDVFPASDKELIRSMISSSIQAVISQTLMKTKDGKGRVAAHEIMLGTPSVRNLIRENKIPQLNSMIQIGSKHGMVSMKDSLTELVRTSKISQESADSMMNLVSGKADFDDKGDGKAKNAAPKPQAPSEDPNMSSSKKSVFESRNDSMGGSTNYSDSDF
jgi:twitching motility protein PilT